MLFGEDSDESLMETAMRFTSLLESVKAVELDWFAENDIVRVTPRDQSRFDVQKDLAIDILQKARESEHFQKQFSLLLQRLAEWVNVHHRKIEQALVTLQDGVLCFVVVRKEVKYDEAIQDELADLDTEITNDPALALIEFKALALPNLSSDDALKSFLDERLILVYHGQRKRPPSTRES